MTLSQASPPPHLKSLNTGRPQIVLRDGRQYSTAINRRAVEGRVRLTAEGIDGDRVADRNVHGGPDKAICCYPREHYPHFSKLVGVELTVPAFGENFTTAGLLEGEVCVGDTFRVGSAVVQITQPRQPCFKLANKHRQPQIIGWIYETGFCGFYFRVLQTGEVGSGDAFEPAGRIHEGLTITRLLAIRADPHAEPHLWNQLAELPALSDSWRKHFARRVNGGSDDDAD